MEANGYKREKLGERMTGGDSTNEHAMAQQAWTQ